MTWINRVDGTTLEVCDKGGDALEVSNVDRNALEVCSEVGRATGVWSEGSTDGRTAMGEWLRGLR